MKVRKYKNKTFKIKRYNKRRKIQTQILVLMLMIVIALTCVVTRKVINQNGNNVRNIKVSGEQKIVLDSKNKSNNNKDNNEETKKNEIAKEQENYEDASIVYENTSALLKMEKNYPVRTDGKKVVYLTFDDGPSTTNTPQILRILKEKNIKATFFVAGYAIDSNDQSKQLLKQIFEDGHSIGNHTYCHNYSYLYPGSIVSVTNFMDDVEKCNQSIRNVLGQDFNIRIIRFPGGYWSWKGRDDIKPLLDSNGYYEIDWNAIDGDAEGNNLNSDQILEKTKYYTEILGPNADSIVLLMHDTYGKEETVKALPNIIEYYRSKGFIFKAIK